MPQTRWLRLLTIFAMLFASISMASGHAAMAMPGMTAPMSHHSQMQMQMPSGHCGDMGSTHKAPRGSGIDCTIACSVIQAFAGAVAERQPMVSMAQPLMKEQRHDGLNPESDPPPPRHS